MEQGLQGWGRGREAVPRKRWPQMAGMSARHPGEHLQLAVTLLGTEGNHRVLMFT